LTKLIVGLGNPGPRYRQTRHNVGFAVVAEIGHRHGIKARPRTSSLLGEGRVAGQAVALAEPTTMMNASGRAVAALTRALNVHDLRQLLVIVDEMDLPLGTIRIRGQGSAGGHNGIKSIIQTLGTQDFPRMRVGVGRPPPGEDPVDYLLSRFTPKQREMMDEAVRRAADAVEFWLQHGTEEAMNQFNGVAPPPSQPS
jgi:PTH1 family peptidyl-tRNA hydrolase